MGFHERDECFPRIGFFALGMMVALITLKFHIGSFHPIYNPKVVGTINTSGSPVNLVGMGI